MKTLKDLDYQKVNVITIEQYAWKGNGYNITIEHHYSTKDPKGTWKYFGGSIWDSTPTFDSKEELIDYIENKRGN